MCICICISIYIYIYSMTARWMVIASALGRVVSNSPQHDLGMRPAMGAMQTFMHVRSNW